MITVRVTCSSAAGCSAAGSSVAGSSVAGCSAAGASVSAGACVAVPPQAARTIDINIKILVIKNNLERISLFSFLLN